MTALSYQVHIFTAGTTAFSTGNVEFSLSGTLGHAPTIQGPVIRPFEGRTEARQWSVQAVDSSGGFTAQLADIGGRMDLLNRWLQVRRTQGGVTSVIGGGRLQDVELQSDQSYNLNVLPEVSLSKALTIFNTTNTTRLYPPGPHRAYGPFTPPPKGKVRRFGYARPPGSGSTFLLVQFQQGWAPMQDLGLEAIRNDIVDGFAYFGRAGGNFRHLRLRIGNTDYPIAAFVTKAFAKDYLGVSGIFSSGLKIPDIMAGLEEDPPLMFVEAKSTAFSAFAWQSSAFMHMFSAPPSEATPLHIGTSVGMHPMTLKRQLLLGSYASSGQPRPRFSTAAFDTGTTGLERIPMPAVRFRITGPEALGRWMEDRLNAPFGVVDFLDSSGRIRSRRIWLPNSTTPFSYAFTAANLRTHPTWLHPLREMVTEIQLNYTQEDWAGPRTPDVPNPNPGSTPRTLASQRPAGGSGDYLKVTPEIETIRHDRISRLGTQTLSVQADGVHTPIHTRPEDFIGIGPTDTPDPNLAALSAQIGKEIFDRWGDGPILGTLAALSTAEAVEAGDFCRVVLNTFPNPGIGARGGTRLVQVMSRHMTPYGPEFDYLDAGPNLNPLSAPTVTLALSTVERKHAVKVTIASLSTAASFQLDLAKSNTTAAPASTSALWVRIRPIRPENPSAGTYVIAFRPSGTKFWGRVRAVQAGRVRSTWRTSTAGITTSGIAAPVITGVSNIKSQTLDMAWTLGNSAYPLQVFADTSTSASFSATNMAAMVGAGQRRISLSGLTAATKHLLGVRHADIFGGVGASDSTTATTLSASSANYAKCQAPAALYLVTGST